MYNLLNYYGWAILYMCSRVVYYVMYYTIHVLLYATVICYFFVQKIFRQLKE